MNAIAFAFNNAASAQENGIRVGGTKYVFNKIEDLANIPVLHCAKVTIPPFAEIFALCDFMSLGANLAPLRRNAGQGRNYRRKVRPVYPGSTLPRERAIRQRRRLRLVPCYIPHQERTVNA